MSKVLICGIGSTTFGDHSQRSIRSLATEASDIALQKAGITSDQIEKIFFANAAAGVVTQQEMIRGQVAFRQHGLAGTPLINIENACASGGSAVHLAFEAVRAGQADAVLVVGVEKLKHEEKMRAFKALHGSIDIEEHGEMSSGVQRTSSILMDLYANLAKEYLIKYRATPRDFAEVAVKNRLNAANNPHAHFRKPQTIEEVLNARMVCPPMTIPMCAPLTDGAVALVICSEQYAKKLKVPAVEILANSIACTPASGESPVSLASQKAYLAAKIGIHDLDLLELHDASAPAELFQYAEVGLCKEGEAHLLLRDGYTAIDGKLPVNTSGGLLSRGHALGATGCAQIAELCYQLSNQAGERQIQNVNTAMAINGGGWIGETYALSVATILKSYKSA
ncbi:thiolase family protein [Zhongshania sp.]|jgi:acetyl-CoA acetyltransferase|uniref:thiolase family protein n=1 Tax=Zhongshania sp. TaxID=1971902 RepID=UPI002A7EC732|nr:thiolase family protein [Zhongshania sp.]